MFRALRNRKGVTLVELLAVVVILGIIAAIAVPTIGGLIARQQEKADKATLQNVVEAARLYALEDADGEFTLALLGASDYIDLGTNKIAITENGTEAIYIKVSGSTVTFHSVDTVLPANYITTMYVNGTLITLVSGSYSS